MARQRFIKIGETSYTKQLARFVATLRYEDLPPEVVERTKLITLHTIGVALAAKDLQLTQSAGRVARCINGGPGGSSTVWTSGERMSAAAAVFLNGTAADALDWEDCSWTGHPSAGMIPAAFAVGEETGCTGREFLTAVVTAFEVYQRVAMSVQPGPGFDHAWGWGIAGWQIFTAVTAAAKLYGLNENAINRAFGMAVLFHKMPTNLQQATMADGYHYEQGFSAASGILAAWCAREGLQNLEDCFDIPYAYHEQLTDTVHREWLTRELGSRFLIMDLLIKHWPADMWVQMPVEVVLELVRENNLDPDQIKEILIDPPTQGRMHFDPNGYTSLLDAQFSMPFVIATALYSAHVGAEWYVGGKLTDPKILALAAKIRGSDREPTSLQQSFLTFQCGGYPVKRVCITMRDGKTFQKVQAFHKGHPNLMMNRQEFKELFLEQTRNSMTLQQSMQLYHAILRLDEAENLDEISAILRERSGYKAD